MAISASLLVTGARSTDQQSTTGTTSSISPAANSLLLIIVGANFSAISSVSGLGLTWTRAGSTYSQFGEVGIDAFWAVCGPSPGSGALTIANSAGQFAYSMHYSVLQFTGAAATSPVVQSVGNSDASFNPVGTLTLASAANSANRAVSAWHCDDSSTWAPRTNWTELSEASTGPRLQTQWRSNAFETTASATPSFTIGPAWAGLAFEIAAAKTEELTDEFTGTTVDTAKWDIGGTVTQNGTLSVPCSGSYSGVMSDRLYSLVGSHMSVETVQRPTGASTQMWMRFQLDANNEVMIGAFNTSLYTLVKTAGVNDELFQTYNATNHKYWRIRESGGTIFFETSANGTSWTQVDSATTPAWVTSGKQDLRSGHWNTEGAPGTAIFDRFNMVGVSAPVAKSGAETATGTDSGAVTSRTFASADTASGVDNAAITSRAFTTAETATGADSGAVTFRAVTSADTATGIDSGSTAAAGVSSADTVTADDSASVFVAADVIDTASGIDDAGLFAEKSASETASASDEGNASEGGGERVLTGIIGRWRASDLELTDGAAVSTWPDVSGNGFDATQTTTSAKPTFHTSDPDGNGSFPVVSFDGTGDFLDIAYAADLNDAALSVGVVVRSRQASGRGGIYWWRPSTSQGFGLMGDATDGVRLYTLAAVITTGQGAFSSTDYYVATADLVTGSQHLFQDGAAGSTGTATYTPNSGTDGYIGRWNSGFWHGDVAEIVHFDHVLTEEERAEWHSYVQDTYGIQVDDYVPPSGATPRQGADTATAVDSASVTSQATDGADSALSDELGAVGAGLSTVDTATSTDTASTTAATAASDTAGAVEAASVAAPISTPETASALDEATTFVAITGSDTASSAEAVGAFDFAGTDSGTHADAAAVAATFTSPDAGTSTDAHAISTTTDDDATALDAGATSNDFTAGETAFGAEGMPSVTLAHQEAVSTLDSASVSASATGTDTASGVEVATLAAAVPVGEILSASDDGTTGNPTGDSDTATASESATLAVTFTTGDTSASTDMAGAPLAEVPATESASTVELVGTFELTAGAETATAADGAALHVAVDGAESGAGTDGSAVALTVAETATGLDDGGPDVDTASKTASDAATALDETVSTSLSVFETAVAGELTNPIEIAQNDQANTDEAGAVALPAVDSGTGTDSAAVDVAAIGRSATDEATGLDAASLALSAADTALLDDAAALVAALSRVETLTAFDIAAVVAQLVAADSGTSTDAASLGVIDITVSDSASSADTTGTAAALTAADLALVVELLTGRADGVSLGVFSSVARVGSFASVADGDAAFTSTASGGRFS